ncbi:MAG: NYN domain-containing protein [Candidatus Eremiobacteraeota bacterium]|nr:NYN domain-containing protein [Candidatus Eremiobacteraeota bacterium]
MERVAIFIDGWNFAKATYEGLGIRVDFKRLLTALTGGRTLLRSLYYIGEWTEESYNLLQELRRARGFENAVSYDPTESERKRAQQQGFIRMLNRNGYQVVKKPVRVFADGNTKADLDIELAIDMLTLAERCERMVLVSGDSDFVPVIKAVGMRGVRVEVVGSQQPYSYLSSADHPRPFPARASDELIDAADEFTELKDLVPAIELQEPRRPRTFHPAGFDGGQPNGNGNGNAPAGTLVGG